MPRFLLPGWPPSWRYEPVGTLSVREHPASPSLPFLGDRMAESLFRIKYKEPIEKETLCTKTLDADDIESFYNAIEELYFWEIFVRNQFLLECSLPFVRPAPLVFLPHAFTRPICELCMLLFVDAAQEKLTSSPPSRPKVGGDLPVRGFLGQLEQSVLPHQHKGKLELPKCHQVF